MTEITKTASAVVIHKYGDSTRIFMEYKGDKYPLPEFRNCLCLIGGHWIGNDAKADINPRATLHRELLEELSLEKGKCNTAEMQLLDPKYQPINYTVKPCKVPIEKVDIELFDEVKYHITRRLQFFCSYLSTFENKGGLQSTYVSYFTAPLLPEFWDALEYLQEKYGNLSNESETHIATLPQLATNWRIGFGHAQVLKDFFSSYGYANRAMHIKTLPNVNMRAVPDGEIESYLTLLAQYNIKRNPL